VSYDILRHLGSTVANIRMRRTPSQIELEVVDDGKGMTPEKKALLDASGKAGVGVRGMREPVRQLGGNLDSKPAEKRRGIVVLARLPVQQTSTSLGA